MSIKVMSWVWEHSQSKGMDRLVLLAIADNATDDGSNAYPSMAKLMAKTGLTDRGIQKCMARLVESGELVVFRNAGPRGCNRYRVKMRTPEPGSPPPNDVPPEQDSPRTTFPPNQVHQTPEPRSPETVLEPSVEISSSKRSPSRKRGTRIPTDFAITDPMRSWAYTEAAEVLGREPDHPKLDVWLNRWTAEFIDYWAGRSGATATKVDWPATWRNRVRTKLEQAAQQVPQPGNAVAVRNGHSPKPSTTDQRVAAGLALAEDLKRRRQS